jgi:hypothetical protein
MLSLQFMESFAHESTMEDVVAKVSANSTPLGGFSSATPFGVGRSLYIYTGFDVPPGMMFQLVPWRPQCRARCSCSKHRRPA